MFRKLSREHLVAIMPCGYDCTRPCCTARICVNYKGGFEDGELAGFSEEQRKEIESLWSENDGYYGENGCRLPRRLRSIICLSYDCKYVAPGTAH